MENASKALIIAGAILISIMIIGLGVLIYQRSSSAVSKINMGSKEAQAQNQQFEEYFKQHVSSTEVKQLLSLVRSNNLSGANNGENNTVYVAYCKAGTKPTELAKGDFNAEPDKVESQLRTGSYYTVNVINSKSGDEPNPYDGGDTGVTPDKLTGFYKNAFVKCIYILEEKASAEAGH